MGRRGNTTERARGGREGGESDGGGIGREGKDVYAESSSARRATFIGVWMYDDDCCQLLYVTRVLIL